MDGTKPPGFDDFIDKLRNAVLQISKSGPWFLRTGVFSGKHNWKNTCYLSDLSRLPQHVINLVEFSHLVDMFGLPHNVWVVREFLTLTNICLMPRYGDMPLSREYRCFVKNGDIQCIHPYWPIDSIKQGLGREPTKDELAELREYNIDNKNPQMFEICQQVAKIFNNDGGWSVDLCETSDGEWYVTDMAVAQQSWHWPGCKNQNE